MAREVKMPYDFVTGEPINIEKLKAFEALVRADEQEKYKWDIHSCGPTCKRYACVAMREAVEAEREACAKVCESEAEMFKSCADGANDGRYDWKEDGARDCAYAIRARGNT
jgi:predicted ArsR family transcriptional regulator